MDTKIHFNRSAPAGREWEYMRQAVAAGHLSGDGEFTRRCHEWLKEHLGVHSVLLTTSCTHALEMAALLLELDPGDEVIVPDFTFVSTVNAFVLHGARPVFCDIRPDTLNLDERILQSLITERTRAIVPVHYAGVGCEMDAILTLAASRGISVIEDNAHGLFGRYRGRMLGSLGRLAAQSFHETKNVTCGEGGALLINDPALVERAEIIREKGTNRSRFFRGQVDKYSWVDIGSSYLPSELLAAYLLAQLEASSKLQAARRRIWGRYAAELGDWAAARGVRLPVIPPHCEHPYHMFYLLMPGLDVRQAFIAHMRAMGILAVFHYLPLHRSVMGASFVSQGYDCPVSRNVSDRLVRLPFYAGLTEADQGEVIAAAKGFTGWL
ncbi:MAG: dTDP-4-amino-4,6-dideoxygalactose transaminase [Planctomycetes bacterium]|nr:dTDP-4-amino-4,6-dideoxygalactose transaminase [Planctomycetota bacterium]